MSSHAEDVGMINEWIRKQFALTGKSQAGLGRAMNINATQVGRILNGQRRVKADEIQSIEAYFGAKYSQDNTTVTQEYSIVRSDFVSLTDRTSPLDVPEFGVAAGNAPFDGVAFDFSLNGVVVNYAPRPRGIARLKNPYLVRMVGDSMSPRYNEGEPLYVDPDRPPAIGDYVVLQMVPKTKGDPFPALVKKLVGRTDAHYKLGQHNPERVFTVQRPLVFSIHRVIPWPELIGL